MGLDAGSATQPRSERPLNLAHLHRDLPRDRELRRRLQRPHLHRQPLRDLRNRLRAGERMCQRSVHVGLSVWLHPLCPDVRRHQQHRHELRGL